MSDIINTVFGKWDGKGTNFTRSDWVCFEKGNLEMTGYENVADATMDVPLKQVDVLPKQKRDLDNFLIPGYKLPCSKMGSH